MRMPAQVSWYDPDKILLQDFSEQVTTDELQHVLHESIDHLNQTSNRVHLIMDWKNATDIPNIMAVLNDATALIQHERMGFVGVVGVNQLLSYWMQVLGKTAGLKASRFDTAEDAAAFLRRL
jgi:hypothetical protein